MFSKLIFICAVIGIVAPLSVAADPVPSALPFLSPIFTNNMVLQRGHENPVWGWTVPGSKIKLTFAEITPSCKLIIFSIIGPQEEHVTPLIEKL